MAAKITYTIEPELDADEFIDVLRRSTLAERRPVEDRARMEQMLRNASVIACARSEGLLVGVARTISDFCYCSYLSDLAVDQAFQRCGIGKALIRQTHLAAPDTTMIILAAPRAMSYYEALGLEKHPSCWILRPGSELEWLRG